MPQQAATEPAHRRARLTGPMRHPHDRQILRLAVPAFGALVAEPLFLLADTAIVGRLGTTELAGLGVAGTVLATVVYLCVFLAYGSTAAVARRLGAGDLRGAVTAGVDGMWLAAGLGVVLLLAGFPLAEPVVHAFGASPDAASHAVVYLRISLFGIPAMLVVLAATGVLRGLQDTRTPLVVAVVAATTNVVLNLVLVYPAGLGIAGSALGTVLSQTGAAAAYVVVTMRAARRLGADPRPRRHGIRAAATAGVPLLLRTVSLRVVLLAAAYVAARLGDVTLAAHQVTFAIWTFLALALDAVAIAGQAIVGRALGAGDVPGTRAATRRMIEWGVATGVGYGLLVLALREPVVPLFSPDAAVQAAILDALVVVAVLQPVAGAVFVLDGVLIGAGDARYLAVSGVGTMVAFLGAAGAVLVADAGIVALWLAMGVFMVARLGFLGVRAYGRDWLVTGAS